MRNKPGVGYVPVPRLFLFVPPVLLLSLLFAAPGDAASGQSRQKKRFFVVSSYHKEYNWSIETNNGFCDSMLRFRYFDNREQAAEFTRNDYVETSRAVVKKMWMDSKRKKSSYDKSTIAAAISKAIKEFDPDILLLGDDEAAEYVGSRFLGSRLPVVFWGLNHNPMKYGLVDRPERPGHNVTGVYQSGYHAESVRLLRKIVPGVRSFAILSDDTPSGRSNLKAVEYLVRKGDISLKLVETVATNDAELWKKKALELQEKVDAFYVAQYSGLKDPDGKPVPDPETAAWYVSHIRIPEFAGFRFRVEEGMLCAADDSGYNQAFEVVGIARDILVNGARPATYPIRAPKRGALVANRWRAEILGIRLTEDMGIEEYVEKEATSREP
jgi:ABC-type uncharacterized transport system substrate-binding protein